jgi:hypothetical protein
VSAPSEADQPGIEPRGATLSPLLRPPAHSKKNNVFALGGLPAASFGRVSHLVGPGGPDRARCGACPKLAGEHGPGEKGDFCGVRGVPIDLRGESCSRGSCRARGGFPHPKKKTRCFPKPNTKTSRVHRSLLFGCTPQYRENYNKHVTMSNTMNGCTCWSLVTNMLRCTIRIEDWSRLPWIRKQSVKYTHTHTLPTCQVHARNTNIRVSCGRMLRRCTGNEPRHKI